MSVSLKQGEKKALRDKFDCYGHFYDIYDNDSNLCACRSILEIIDNRNLIPDELYFHKPSAIFFMMNPGSSKPSNPLIEPQKIQIYAMNTLRREQKFEYYCKTDPDDTQYFVMKLMNDIDEKWKHVIVLNLSDIRAEEKEKLESSLEDFIYKTTSINESFHHVHSILSSYRREELLEILEFAENIPIIKSWGVDNCLIHNYATICCSLLDKLNWKGFEKEGTNFRYYHPLHKGWYDTIKSKL